MIVCDKIIYAIDIGSINKANTIPKIMTNTLSTNVSTNYNGKIKI